MQGARLEVSDAMGRTQVVPIEDDRVTIRRALGNMVSLDGAEISRWHAEIVKEGESYPGFSISLWYRNPPDQFSRLDCAGSDARTPRRRVTPSG